MNSPTRSFRRNSSGAVADIATILVPVDCGPRSRALLRSAAALARVVGGHLVILHVYEPLTYAPAHTTAEQLRICQDVRLRKASERIQLLRGEFLDDPEVQSATLIAIGGFPDDTIREMAIRTHADLIVASTHGYRGFNRLFLGSRAEQLIRNVPCPILILPAAVEGSDEEKDVIELHRKSSPVSLNRRFIP